MFELNGLSRPHLQWPDNHFINTQDEYEAFVLAPIETKYNEVRSFPSQTLDNIPRGKLLGHSSSIAHKNS